MPSVYRRTGADTPFSDPGAFHGVGMEGYYWRIVAPSGRVLVALCGACRTGSREWAVVAIADHPSGAVHEAVVESRTPDAGGFGVRTPVLDGSASHLNASVGAARIDVALRPVAPGPRRALGLAHLVPWLPQYWQPVAMAAEVSGTAVLGGEEISLDGARAYLEKNWGRGFAGDWWWGQAGFEDGAGVAFAGGPVLRVPVSAVALSIGGRTRAFATPAALMRHRIGAATWELRARAPGWEVEIDAAAVGGAPHVLPVPDVGAGAVRPRSRQWLAGRLALTVRRRGRLVFAGETDLAGLERGEELWPARPGAPRP